MLSNVSESRNYKMAAAKLEMHVSQLVDKIDSKFKKAPTMFSRMANSVALIKKSVVRRERKSKNPKWPRLNRKCMYLSL